jgi:hypothetical protein
MTKPIIKGIPDDIAKEMVKTAHEALAAHEMGGRGYVYEYYRRFASYWDWLYRAGVEAGKKSRKR